jgi:hypothetical protein
MITISTATAIAVLAVAGSGSHLDGFLAKTRLDLSNPRY